MGVLVYVLGRSGTGKSYSMRNFKPEELAVINVQGKILPFKGSGAFDIENTDDSADIVKAIGKYSKKYKSIVIDDFQYVMANEFMRRATERGYDKFTEIARHAWDIANEVRTLPNDVIVYIMCHTDTDADGSEKLKTIGKLLDEKIVLEGMSTIVLKTAVSDGQYMFLTQNNGKDTVKSPAGMFPTYAIDNDLKYVDEKIRGYYELGGFTLSEDEMKEIDEAAAKVDVIKEEPKKKRGGKRGKAEEKEQTNAPTEEKEEKPKRSRRIKEELEKEREAVHEENGVAIATENGKLQGTDVNEEVPFEEADEPELKEPPKRKSRKKAEEQPVMNEPEEPEKAPATTTRRRRKRG